MTEDEVKALLERQAAWQRGRAALPWAEKLRMCVAMREGIEAMRAGRVVRRPDRAPGDHRDRHDGG